MEVLLIDGAQSRGDGDGEGDLHGLAVDLQTEARQRVGVNCSCRFHLDFEHDRAFGPADDDVRSHAAVHYLGGCRQAKALSQEPRKVLVDDALVRARVAGGGGQIRTVPMLGRSAESSTPMRSWGIEPGSH